MDEENGFYREFPKIHIRAIGDQHVVTLVVPIGSTLKVDDNEVI